MLPKIARASRARNDAFRCRNVVQRTLDTVILAMTAMRLKASDPPVDSDFNTAHYGTRRAPGRLWLHHYHSKAVES